MPGVKNPKPLSKAHQTFAEKYALEMNGMRAYMAAFPHVKSKTVAQVNASRLLRNAMVKAEIERIKAEGSRLGAVLSLAEKRAFLAAVVRTPIGDIDHTSPLCQERTYIEGKDEDSIKIKSCDKLRALQIDAELSGELKGDNAGDAPVYSTPAELVEVLKLQALALWGRDEDVRLARAAVTRR